MLVCSYNPAYRSSLKELKPSFRQRFVTLPMRYLPPDREAEVIVAEAGIPLSTAQRLVQCAIAIRTADDAFHFEPPSTRVLVTAAQLIAAGATELEAAEACILAPLSTDGAITDGLREVAAQAWPADSTSLTLGRELIDMDQKEQKRKRALIVLQIVIYGYLLTMFGIQLYMSFARGWWEL